MEQRETFEERIGPALDFLFDGASLLVGDPRRAEELVVATVLDASRRYGRPDVPGDLRRWIVAGLVRCYLEHSDADGEPWRREPGSPGGARRARPSEGAEEPAREGALETLVVDLAALERRSPARLREAIRGCLRALPARERLSVWLVDVMEFSYSEATRAMGLAADDFRRTLYRARRELQGLLGPAVRSAIGGDETASRRGGEA